MSEEKQKVINAGGPAFPQKEPLTNDCQGMSLRDYFAGQALACSNWMSSEQVYIKDAEMCYLIADAMLEARNR